MICSLFLPKCVVKSALRSCYPLEADLPRSRSPPFLCGQLPRPRITRTAAGVRANQIVSDVRPGPAPPGSGEDPDRQVLVTVEGQLPA